MIETGKVNFNNSTMLYSTSALIYYIVFTCVNKLQDAPWCDIRTTHASHKYLNLSEEKKLLYQPPTRKKEKFELGCMVKGRNEPCCIG